MTDWLILFSNIAAGSVRTIIGLFLIYRLLAMKKPGRNSVIIAAVGIVVISAILSITGLSDFYRTVIEIVWIAVCAGYFQNADTRMSFFVSIFYEIAISLCQFLVAAWSGVIFHLSALLGENGRTVCCSDRFCNFVLKYPYRHFVILRPGFRAGDPHFTRLKESVLYTILPVYLFL